jgi:hypothetical protein
MKRWLLMITSYGGGGGARFGGRGAVRGGHDGAFGGRDASLCDDGGAPFYGGGSVRAVYGLSSSSNPGLSAPRSRRRKHR